MTPGADFYGQIDGSTGSDNVTRRPTRRDLCVAAMAKAIDTLIPAGYEKPDYTAEAEAALDGLLGELEREADLLGLSSRNWERQAIASLGRLGT